MGIFSKPKAPAPPPPIKQPTPAPVPDDKAVEKNAQKEYARRRKASGRASTLLTERDTLG